MTAIPRESSTMSERVPPQATDLEMCVLGAIMLEPEYAYALAADYLTRDSFYLDGNGIIFDLMGDLIRRDIMPDANAVVDELRSRQLIEKIGGAGVVMGMINSVPSAANIEYHSRILAEKALSRGLIRRCTTIIDDCYRQDRPIDDILDEAERNLFALGSSKGAESVRVSGPLELFMDELERRDIALKQRREAGEENPRLDIGLPTGFYDIDYMTGGFKRGELIIPAARPSVGKTAFALSIAQNIAVREQVPVAIFSLEMDKDQIGQRLLSMGTMHSDGQTLRGVSSTRFNNPNLDDWEWSLLTKSYQQLGSAPIYIDDTPMLTVRQIRSRSRKFVADGCKMIIVDYLQLMQGSGKQDNRTQDVSEMSRGLKLIARELRVPVVALSQLSRQVENRKDTRPRLSDLRESGSIEQDADVVIMLEKPDDWENLGALVEMPVHVEKNRNGPTGSIKLSFFKSLALFLNQDGVHG